MSLHTHPEELGVTAEFSIGGVGANIGIVQVEEVEPALLNEHEGE